MSLNNHRTDESASGAPRTRPFHAEGAAGAFVPFVGLLVLAVLLLGITPASAQFEVKDMEVGNLTHQYSEIGNEPFPSGGYDYAWPAWMMGSVDRDIQTAWYHGLWIARKNFTDADGETWQAKIAHVGPRATGANEFFPTEFRTISRFEPPVVSVDGLPSFRVVADNDEIDPDLPSDRKIVSRGNTITGISFTREVYAWGQEHHDDYHIQVYTFTNTGNTDGDEEIEIEDQTAQDVYIHRHRRPDGHRVLDVEGTDFDYDGRPEEDDIRAIIQFPWVDAGEDNTLGRPNVESTWGFPEPDTLGRLSDAAFAGVGTIFASKSADQPDVNAMVQPTTTNFNGCDDQLMAIGQDGNNATKMRREYDELSKGHETPHHADWVNKDGDFTTLDGDPMFYADEGFDQGGQCSEWSYGPYTLEPGESVRIVTAEAVDGLTPYEASVIGRAFKDAGEDEEAPITFRGETMGKNDWWYTARDSLMETLQKAQMHYYEGLGSIPQAPLPPRTLDVRSGVDRVAIEWTTYEGASPQGWELFRTRSYVSGLPQNNFKYEKIATLDPSARSYTDTDVSRGIEYFYYLQAVGAASENDGSIMTEPGALRSSRMYGQTWDGASLKREPGETTSSARVVPNPLDLSSPQGVRWPGRDLRVGFLDIPGMCTIRIYTEAGELVKTIEHTDGSGDEFWNLRTEDEQLIASGVYVALIENHDPGPNEQAQVYEKFIIIR